MPKLFRLSHFLLAAFSLVAPCSQAIDGPLTPEQAIASFKLEPGLRVECVASEPMVVSPVAVAFDEKARMYVVEDRGYPLGPGRGKPGEGQVVLLQSTKGDGHYDKRTVFADKLSFPNGVLPWKGGVYVTCAPYLYYFKDTNDDGVADIKQIVFKGFQDLSTTQLRVSHPLLAIDNWIYLTSGLTVAKVTSPLFPGHPEVLCNRTDFRFRPDKDEFEATTGTAQFGQTFDDFGHKFICSNRNHNQNVVMQSRYLTRNPNLDFAEVVQDIPDHGAASRVFALSHNIVTFAAHAGYFTSACGVTIYNGTALPEKYRGNSFTCEPAGNLVHHDVLSASNATFVAKREFDNLEFLASPDNWCRPVNLANSPDGALYLCDMYRKTIEHPAYLPEETAKVTDFKSGKDKGRVYRLMAADRKEKIKPFDLGKSSLKQLVEQFNNPNGWWRTTAQRLLLERNDPAATPYLEKALKKAGTPQARALALRMLEALGTLNETAIVQALHDKNAAVREQGILVAEPLLAKSSSLLAAILPLANDPDGKVRFQCALTLGESADPRVIPALAKIASQNLDDKWTRAAVLTAVGKEPARLLELLLAHSNKNSDGMSAMLVQLARLVGIDEEKEKITALLNKILASSAADDFAWQLSAVTGLADGAAARSTGSISLVDLVQPSTPGRASSLEKLLQHAAATALDSSQPLSQRLVAINLINRTDATAAVPALLKLTDSRQPTDIQLAAVRAIGQSGDATVIWGLLTKERWSGYTPIVRDAIVTISMTKPELTGQLLSAVEKNMIPAWSVNADRRGQMMRSGDQALSQRATALFKDMKVGDRMKIYEECKASILPLKANPKKGHGVFTRTCTPCHMYDGEGHTVGPDLTGIRNQPKEVLLLHIVIPEFEIMPIYTLYSVDTTDGQSYSGLLAADTAETITLRQAAGVEQKIPRAKIDSLRASTLSLMPQELEKTMSKQDMADLLGYLKGE